MHFLFSSNHLSFDHSHQSPWLRTLGFQISIITRWLRFRELSGIGYRDSFAWSKCQCAFVPPVYIVWSLSGVFHTISPSRAIAALTPCRCLSVCYHFTQAYVATVVTDMSARDWWISMNTYSASIQLFYVPFLFSPLTAVGVASFFFRCCINSASNGGLFHLHFR